MRRKKYPPGIATVKRNNGETERGRRDQIVMQSHSQSVHCGWRKVDPDPRGVTSRRELEEASKSRETSTQRKSSIV